MIALFNVVTEVESKNLTNTDGFGNANGLELKIFAISAGPWAVLNKSDVTKFLYGVVRSINFPLLSTF